MEGIRLMRRFTAGLVVSLAAVLLPVSAASADPLGTVTGVTAEVNARTPLYHLEMTFSLVDVTCPAVVDYEMGGTTTSASIVECIGDPDGTFATATATAMRPMFGPGLSTINPGGTDCDDAAESDGPGCQVHVIVRHANAGVQTSGQQVLRDPDTDLPVEVPIPPRPVWVGVGDGYTSRTTQMLDACYGPDSADDASEALGTTVTVSTDGDAIVCTANSAYVDPDLGWEVWYHPDTFENFWYDRDADELWGHDGNDFVPASDFDVTIDQLLPEMGGETHYTTTADFGAQSWIHRVVQTFNGEYEVGGTEDTPGSTIPCDDGENDDRCWTVVPEVVADADVFAADLAEGGAEADITDDATQLGQLHDLLTSDRHRGSWNWVGMSAGLLDAGIPQAINDEYPTDGGGDYLYEPLDGTGYVPWRPAGGDPCPALPEVTPAIQSDVTAGITNVLDQAMAWSPGLKAIVVRYPWLTERTSTATGEANPCAADVDEDGTPDNREPITALNGAIDAALAGYDVGDDVFELNLAAELNLQEGFSDEPTDSVPDRQSFLQLTRPVGYPYPSDYGSSTMGSDAFKSIEESGVTPPTIEGVVVEAADSDPDTPSTSAESQRNGEGWYNADDDLWVEWQADAPEGVLSVTDRSPLLRGANRTYTGTVVDSVNQSATATETVNWDPDEPRVVPAVSGTFNSVSGWYYATKPTVSWTVVDDVNASLYDGFAPSGPGQTPASISNMAEGRDVTVTSGTGSDKAGNTATGTKTLNVDTVAPAVRGVVSVGDDWVSAPSAYVDWERYDLTSGVRRSASDTVGIVGQTDVERSSTITKEGRTEVSHTVYDVAGNKTVEEVEVLLDRTSPDIEILGIPTGTVTIEDLEDVIEGVECLVTNEPKGSVNEVSPLDDERGPDLTVTPGTGGLTYTFVCEAVDEAGNETIRTRSFFVEVDDPPTIVGEYVTPANSAGWWNTNVQIAWTATPAPGWGLHPFLGALHGGNWTIDGDGLGHRTTTHPTEGIYDVTSPTACHSPQPGGTCAPTITKGVKLDKTPPRVDPNVSGGTPGGGGWYRSGPVDVSWLVGDVVPAGLTADKVSGVASTSLPSTTVSQQGITTVDAGTVSDRAGNQSTGSTTIKIDAKAPTITGVTGVAEGATYTLLDHPDINDIACTAVDQPPADAPTVAVSGVDANGCKVGLVGLVPSTDQYGPPMVSSTWQAGSSDVAGNTAATLIRNRLLLFFPAMRGRMTVGGQLQTTQYGKVATSGTLRCNGSPNNLGVTWNGGSFTLNWIDYFYCWDQGNLEGSPDAPIDSLYGIGKGKLANGQDATIEWTFKDREKPTKKSDTMRIVIKNASGQTVLDVGGKLTGGNFQAHDAQGNGTNDNGNVNGPTGNTSNKSQAAPLTQAATLPEPPKVQ